MRIRMAALPRLPRKAGIVVLREDEMSWRCLLLRAYRNWGLPKGEIDPGETPFAAAKREVREETSLSRLEFRWGDIFIDTPDVRGHKVARYYLAVARSDAQVYLPVSPELGRAEHHEFRWVNFTNAKQLLSTHLGPVMAWAEVVCQMSHH
jgi:bis(5'-nucleosidyl)-tetraphosphatase